jgi:hypothetical protein
MVEGGEWRLGVELPSKFYEGDLDAEVERELEPVWVDKWMRGTGG